jgi:hypothetical protein
MIEIKPNETYYLKDSIIVIQSVVDFNGNPDTVIYSNIKDNFIEKKTVSYISLKNFIEDNIVDYVDSVEPVKVEVFSQLKSILKNEDMNPKSKDLIIKFLQARYIKGLETYKVPLTSFNNRSAIQDLLEELLDSLMYVSQQIIELSLCKYEDVNFYNQMFKNLLKLTDEIIEKEFLT